MQVREYNNMADYISLKEAIKHCDYSQDYLKLRARQGKLKAVKIGRNWVTTKEWVEEYANQPARLTHQLRKTERPVLTKKHRPLLPGFKLFFLILAVVLTAYLSFLLVNLDYFKVDIKFLADIESFVRFLIPGKVVELRVN